MKPSRTDTEVVLIERGLGVTSAYHHSKLAFYGTGSGGMCEYAASPFGKLTHILTTPASPAPPPQARGANVQTLGQHHAPWPQVLDALQTDTRGRQRGAAYRPGRGLYRVELTLWSSRWLKSWDQGSAERAETLILVLDHIQDPRNYGAIIRTAAYFGVSIIIVATDRQAEISPTVIHCARGGLGYVKIIQVVNLARVLDQLKALGFWVLGADMGGEDYGSVQGFYTNAALVVGNEGHGLSATIRKKCDRIIRITGGDTGFHSLNVSVACGILMSALTQSTRAPYASSHHVDKKVDKNVD